MSGGGGTMMMAKERMGRGKGVGRIGETEGDKGREV